MSPSQEGSARRRVNELLRLESPSDGVPIAFFCECTDPHCYQPVWLNGAQYDQACADPAWVPAAAGHAPATRDTATEDGAETDFEPLDLASNRDRTRSIDDRLRGVPFS